MQKTWPPRGYSATEQSRAASARWHIAVWPVSFPAALRIWWSQPGPLLACGCGNNRIFVPRQLRHALWYDDRPAPGCEIAGSSLSFLCIDPKHGNQSNDRRKWRDGWLTKTFMRSASVETGSPLTKGESCSPRRTWMQCRLQCPVIGTNVRQPNDRESLQKFRHRHPAHKKEYEKLH